MIVSINYADKNFDSARKWNSLSAKYIGKVDKVVEYSPDDIDPEFKEENKTILKYKRGGGLWLWKPYIILDALKKLNAGDYLIYTDAGSFFIRSAKNLINCMVRDNVDIMLFEISTIEKYFTKRETFHLMECDEKFGDTNQICTGYIILKKTPHSVSFIEKWLYYAKDERISSYKKFIEGIKEHDFFSHHREDQSIVSLLAKKEEIIPYKDPSQFGERPWEYANAKWPIAIKKYSNSPYKSVIISNRKQNAVVFGIKEIIKRIMYRLGIMSKDKYLKKYGIPPENVLYA